MQKPLIFSTEASAYFADKIAARLGAMHGETERKVFAGGERYYRLNIVDRADLLGRDVVYVASTHTDADFAELHRVGCALAGYGTRRRIFVIPFFGYSTMERAVKAGEVVMAKVHARTLSSIPNTVMGNTFLMFDLHTSSLAHFFEGDCLRFELYGEPVLSAAISQLKLRNFMFGTADLGRPLWVKTFARRFGTSFAMIDKDRDFETTKVRAVIGDVAGKKVIIYDDMTRSAGTLVQAAKAYLEEGATAVYVVLSHLACNDRAAFDRLMDSPIERVITTNSHPMSQEDYVLPGSRITVLDVSLIFAQAIQQVLN